MAENGRRLDLNPIWCTDTKNYVSEAKPRNVSELWNVVKDPCSVRKVPQVSLLHRCEAVLINGGQTTEY